MAEAYDTVYECKELLQEEAKIPSALERLCTLMNIDEHLLKATEIYTDMQRLEQHAKHGKVAKFLLRKWAKVWSPEPKEIPVSRKRVSDPAPSAPAAKKACLEARTPLSAITNNVKSMPITPSVPKTSQPKSKDGKEKSSKKIKEVNPIAKATLLLPRPSSSKSKERKDKTKEEKPTALSKISPTSPTVSRPSQSKPKEERREKSAKTKDSKTAKVSPIAVFKPLKPPVVARNQSSKSKFPPMFAIPKAPLGVRTPPQSKATSKDISSLIGVQTMATPPVPSPPKTKPNSKDIFAMMNVQPMLSPPSAPRWRASTVVVEEEEEEDVFDVSVITDECMRDITRQTGVSTIRSETALLLALTKLSPTRLYKFEMEYPCVEPFTSPLWEVQAKKFPKCEQEGTESWKQTYRRLQLKEEYELEDFQLDYLAMKYDIDLSTPRVSTSPLFKTMIF